MSTASVPPQLPALLSTLFVAHAHAERAVIEALRGVLPPGIELDVFFEEGWDFGKSVSPAIVPRILDAGGLIFLGSPLSARSQWVFFEREYALLAKKPIFEFRHEIPEILPWSAKPLDLTVFPSYAQKDHETLAPLLATLRARFFDNWSAESMLLGTDIDQQINDAIASPIARGGYFLMFCTPASLASKWCLAELRQAFEHQGRRDRILPVLVDGAELPKAPQNISAFDLTPRSGKSIAWRIDDLVIHLYEIIAKNVRSGTQPTER